jgi:D-alanyl-D-alanine carboxypeptidase (penicillin-binding protein 5/6)
MNGCGTGKTADIQNPYSLTGDNSSVSSQFFARNLCVTDDINFGTDQVHADYAEGAGVFDLTTKEVLYSQNLRKTVSGKYHKNSDSLYHYP